MPLPVRDMGALFFYLAIALWMTPLAQAEIPAPAAQPAWLRLLHYNSSLQGPWRSSIHSAEFFLSKKGQNDPQAEWNALIQASDFAEQESIACRFPARILLYQRFLAQRWPALPCADYLEWKERLDFHSLSLVYSTAYAGNPASVLGHNVLKLNRHDPRQHDDLESGLPLLDYGMGFLARSDATDGPVSYVLNGLFGGYPGFFILQPYYELVNTYAYAENRDLWELEIKLDPAERELFLAHVWELIHQASAPYHFTHVNCSTMLLEILEAVRPDWNLKASLGGLVLPQAVMQTVAEHEGPSHEHFWPSQKRIFSSKWNHLNETQQERLLFWRHTSDVLAVADDPLILDTIMDQLNMKKARLEMSEQKQLRAQEDQILLARARLPASTLKLPDRSSASNNPLLAHGLHKLSVFAGKERDAHVMGLRLRWGLHDLLDEPQGFNPYYHINFLDLSLWQKSEETQPDYRMEIVDLMSLNPFERVDPAASWAVSLGVHQDADGPRPHFRGSYGLAFELAPDRSLIYVMPDLYLTLTDALIGCRLGWYQAWTAGWRQLLEILPRQSLDQNKTWRWDWHWENRWRLNRGWQVEWRLARAERWQTMVGLGQFF